MNNARKSKFFHLLILLGFLIISIIPNRNAVAELNWPYDNDNSRDMSNVNNMLAGNYFADPCYIGELRWYNPLVHWIETLTVKATGVPVNKVVVQGGTFFNLFAPICFFIMMLILFDSVIAICAIAGFLFFTAGNIPGCFSATYTPWLYPVCFMQFAFYIGIIAMYNAFKKETLKSFILLGVAIGFAFLGHTAPALILILQTAVLTFFTLIKTLRKQSDFAVSKILIHRLVAALSFILVSLPLTITVYGRYHLKMINFATFEFAEPIFQIPNIPQLIIANLSVSFFIALGGFYFLLKSKVNPLIKNIIYSWLSISALLYFYVTASKFIRFHYGIELPGIVPSFHFFFYIKAVEAVLFGFGFVEIISRLIKYLSIKFSPKKELILSRSPQLILITIVAMVLLNYPAYLKRDDFHCAPVQINNDVAKGRIEVYKWIIANTNINDVVLCDSDLITFPLLASGRKMVCCTQEHTNPYVDFSKRFQDELLMLDILKGKTTDNSQLFEKYDVRYFLVPNAKNYKNLEYYFSEKVFSCKKYSVFLREKRIIQY